MSRSSGLSPARPTPGSAAGDGTSGPPAASWSEATWREIAAVDRARSVAVLPVGAVEAHGPHLPLGTDGVIAHAMAAGGARRLAGHELSVHVLPTLDYTAAPFAAGFAGTVSVRPETVTALVTDIADALADQGHACLAIANAHFDPANLGSLHAAAEAVRAHGRIAVAFPDVTRKPWAMRLGEEFASGACHAGSYEGSMVLAARPEAVRDEIRRQLAPNPRSLSRAIRDGLETFEQAGGPDAYFGDPAAASAQEGRERIETLGAILEEAVLAALDERSAAVSTGLEGGES